MDLVAPDERAQQTLGYGERRFFFFLQTFSAPSFEQHWGFHWIWSQTGNISTHNRSLMGMNPPKTGSYEIYVDEESAKAAIESNAEKNLPIDTAQEVDAPAKLINASHDTVKESAKEDSLMQRQDTDTRPVNRHRNYWERSWEQMLSDLRWQKEKRSVCQVWRPTSSKTELQVVIQWTVTCFNHSACNSCAESCFPFDLRSTSWTSSQIQI